MASAAVETEETATGRPEMGVLTALGHILAYVRPYHRLIALATVCGMAKFILPSTMALTLKFITDRPVPSAAVSGDPHRHVHRSQHGP